MVAGPDAAQLAWTATIARLACSDGVLAVLEPPREAYALPADQRDTHDQPVASVKARLAAAVQAVLGDMEAAGVHIGAQ